MKFDTRSTLKNENGQVAIFAALMFQVLFVFFAMSINVSLIVHDKINLQNSADLAAYYGAAKQAEMLNAMAHINYQIRQAYKLYVWRYRVVGTLGLEQTSSDPNAEPHPSSLSVNPSTLTDSEWKYGAVRSTSVFRMPEVCVTFAPTWTDMVSTNSGGTENACKSPQFNIPELPQIGVIAGWNGFNVALAQISANLIDQFDDSCEGQGVWNWWFTNAIKLSFRMDQANRRRLINALAANMARRSDQMVDLDGNSIVQGVEQTLTKNLTWSNLRSGAAPEVRWFNSMEGVPRESWLVPIFVRPQMLWTDITSQAGSGASCKAIPKQHTTIPVTPASLPEAQSVWNQINTLLSGNELVASSYGFAENDRAMRMSVGYEKNPWYMVYSGVEVSTQSRNIFHPFGGPVTITARAFAKPFGGRMGPWYKNMWAPSGSQSDGGAKVDVRGQPRTPVDGSVANPNDEDLFPNYSRFPSDQLGLASRLAQGAVKNLRTQYQASKSYFTRIYNEFQPNNPNDPLAWNYETDQPPPTRRSEIAAIIPDLFDAYYYSVEPNYWENYGQRIENNRGALGLPQDLVVRPDLGYHNGSDSFSGYSVQNQIQASNLLIDQAYYFVRDKQHLLNSFLPGPGHSLFYPRDGSSSLPPTSPEFPFGQCITPDKSDDSNDTSPRNPGSCIAGGRVGYSVKIVARDYLLSSDHKVGGANAGSGPIRNPPNF